MKNNEYLAMRLREYADRVESGAVHDFRIEEIEHCEPIGLRIPNAKEVLITFTFREEER